MQRFVLLFFAIFAFTAVPAAAAGTAAEMWRVSQKSGDVRVIHNRLQPAAARTDAALSPGDLVMTGATGRATLTRGGDYIVLAPSSRLLLPANSPTGMTSVIQEMGTMLFKVRRTGIPHFRVDTPMLAAVVKGTTFTVIVGPDRSAVQVIEGAVEVSAVQGGMSRLVEGGKTVFIANDNPASLVVANEATLLKTSATPGVSVKLGGSGEVDLATVTNLSGGLVRADLAASLVKTAVATTVPTSASVATVATDASGTVTGVTSATTAVNGLVQTTVTTSVATAVGSVVPTVTNVAAAVLNPIVGSGAVTILPTAIIVATVTGTAPTVTILTGTVPPITVPVLTVPVVTAPLVTVPTVTLPTMTLPTVTLPTVTVPVVTVPIVTVPTVTVPVVTVPVVTLPTVTVPAPPTLPCIVCG